MTHDFYIPLVIREKCQADILSRKMAFGQFCAYMLDDICSHRERASFWIKRRVQNWVNDQFLDLGAHQVSRGRLSGVITDETERFLISGSIALGTTFNQFASLLLFLAFHDQNFWWNGTSRVFNMFLRAEEGALKNVSDAESN